MAKKGKKHLKNIAYLVSRNKTKQEIIKVIFPNGLEVGLPDGQFNNGFKVNGNAQVTGIINAQDVRVNGTSLSGAGLSIDFTPNSISVATDRQGGAIDDAGDLDSSDIGSSAFTKVAAVSDSNFTWSGHNAGRTVSSKTSYEIVSSNITGITNNGVSLTATVTDAAAEGDNSYTVALKTGSKTVATFTVSENSNDAKLLLTTLSAHDNAADNQDYNSLIVTVPIVTRENSFTRTFTVQKSLAGASGSSGSDGADGADGVSVDLTRSVIPVDTDDTGGALDDGGDLSDADISDQAFTKIDVNAGTTNITFAGHNESGNPTSNTYKIVTDSMTATTDNGTSLTESNSASEGNTSYDVTFANSGTRLTLAVSTDS